MDTKHFERFSAGFLIVWMVLLLTIPDTFQATPAFHTMSLYAPQWQWALGFGSVGILQSLAIFCCKSGLWRKWTALLTGSVCLFIAVLLYLGNPHGPLWATVGWIALCSLSAAWQLR